MLLQFGFKNFKSFRDEAIVDMTATSASEYKSHIVEQGKERILPVATLYGANASGKSNIYEAFRYMSFYVIDSWGYGGDENKSGAPSRFKRPTPFLFDAESKTQPSTFEVYFTHGDEAGAKTYNYGFSVNGKGICEEWLNRKTKSPRANFKTVFYRNGKELDLSGLPSKSRENIEVSLEPETLIVSLGAKLKIAELKAIRDWFADNECVNFGQPLENLVLSQFTPRNFGKDKAVRDNVIRYFNAFDPSIIDFRADYKIAVDGHKELTIDAIHKMADSDETTSIPLRRESAGTLKMFALYRFLENVLKKGSVLFVDELNSRLHPLLVRLLITTFTNPDINKNHAQLIFTSHDAWQLTGNILRRDEIWFTEKDTRGVSTLYSLADFTDEGGNKIRKDENLLKNYMVGKYGAIPTLGGLDIFGDN